MNFIDDFLVFLKKIDAAPADENSIISDDIRRYYTLENDKSSEKKGCYALKIEGELAIGWAMNLREGVVHSYSSKSDKKFSPEQLAEWKEKSRLAKIKQETELKASREKAAEKANNDWISASIEGEHSYLSQKKIGLNGARILGDKIIVPVRIDGKITSLQTISENGDKMFAAGGEIKGGYFAIATKNEELGKILLTESYSTGCTLREATGLPVVSAFSAGNLKLAALAVKKKFPNSIIVFCADNDQFNVKENIGIVKAEQASAAIGGAVVIYPTFEEKDLLEKPTDWNDAAKLYGNEWVAEKILSAVNPKAEMPSALPVDDCPVSFAPHDAENAGYEEMPVEEIPSKIIKTKGDIDNLPFRVLGYNSGIYYYYSFIENRIISLTPSAHNMLNFFQLANQFQILEPHRDVDGKLLYSEKVIAQTLASKMMSLAGKRGIFIEEDKVRGIGAWIDEGRVFLHCGTEIYVNGKKTQFDDIQSYFTYIAAAKLVTPSKYALNNAEARKLREICEMVTWEKKLSGTLLSGWLVISPICAALQFRPHIFITGEAESGKSTVLNRIIRPSLGKIALCMDGGTTEPAIRTSMGYDARPLVYDEAEPSQSMAGVIELLRKSSTGSVVKKFGQQPFAARFCACLSGINPPVNKTADESRISFMKIKKNIKSTAIQDYADLLDKIDETITEDFAEKLLARTLQNMNSLLENIKIFQKAFRSLNPQSARASELIGTMLAGVYMLGRTDIISMEDALKFIKAHDWSSHTNIQEDSDPIRLLQHIISSLVKTTGGQDISIGELITRVSGGDESANKLLRNHGIRVEREYVSIATRSQNLAKLLKDTDWGMRWGSTLADIKDSTVVNIEYFSPLVKARAVRLPVSLFVENETNEEIINF